MAVRTRVQLSYRARNTAFWSVSGSETRRDTRGRCPRALNGAVMELRLAQTWMWSVAEIGSGVELAELPVASDTTVFE